MEIKKKKKTHAAALALKLKTFPTAAETTVKSGTM